MEHLALPDEQPGGNYSKQRMFTWKGEGGIVHPTCQLFCVCVSISVNSLPFDAPPRSAQSSLPVWFHFVVRGEVRCKRQQQQQPGAVLVLKPHGGLL